MQVFWTGSGWNIWRCSFIAFFYWFCLFVFIHWLFQQCYVDEMQIPNWIYIISNPSPKRHNAKRNNTNTLNHQYKHETKTFSIVSHCFRWPWEAIHQNIPPTCSSSGLAKVKDGKKLEIIMNIHRVHSFSSPTQTQISSHTYDFVSGDNDFSLFWYGKSMGRRKRGVPHCVCPKLNKL